MKKNLLSLSAILAFLSLCGLARAFTIDFGALLSGPAESPPNTSPATGTADVLFDSVAHTLHVQVSFSGLLGMSTASHIHAATAVPGAGTAGVATTLPYFAGFPIGVTSGTYDHVLDLTDTGSYNPAYMAAHGGTPAGAEAALLTAMEAGESYLNIHSTVVPSGEIRGFLHRVPDGAQTAALLAFGILGLAGVSRLLGRRAAARG